MNTLKWKRVYDQAEPSDGDRILVDQLWPRGVSREKAALDGWAKDITPSTRLRQAYHGGRLSFEQFSKSYEEELETNPAFPDFVDDLDKRLDQGDVTLVFAGKVPGETHLPVLRGKLEKAGIKSDPLP
ncbi:MAG TPA: DUF488 family protein [Bacillota bacterium]|nr:DUF488 family protein [Fastidiosipila sp.]HPX92697.1 DUF488 family protein [Bacillota bacterium]HQB80594.1 DUF488 family protein [Bacillota bacterium]